MALAPDEAVCIAWLPLRFPHSGGQDFHDLMDHAVDRLVADSGSLPLALGPFGVVDASIEVADRTWFRHRWSSINHIVLEIQAQVRGASDWVVVRDSKGEVLEPESLDESLNLLSLLFARAVSQLFLSANLTYPGSLDCDSGIVMVDGAQDTTIPSLSSHRLRQAVDACVRTGWPPLADLELNRVHRWVIRQKGFVGSWSEGPTSRALNALANLMDSSEPMDLFWAMLGLESIYVRGHEDCLQQIRAKTEALFSKPEGFKNALDRMYNFRSRLIHGDLDIPGLVVDPFTVADTGRFYEDMDDAVSMAALLLVATFQEMIRRNCDGLEFTKAYAVTEVRTPEPT